MQKELRYSKLTRRSKLDDDDDNDDDDDDDDDDVIFLFRYETGMYFSSKN